MLKWLSSMLGFYEKSRNDKSVESTINLADVAAEHAREIKRARLAKARFRVFELQTQGLLRTDRDRPE